MSIQETPSRIPPFSAAILALLVVFLPWALGGVDPNLKLLMVLAVATSLVLYFVGLAFNRARETVIPLAVLPLLLGAGLAVVQLLPVGPALVERLSPQVALLRQDLLPESAAAETPLVSHLAELPPTTPALSLYSPATRKDLALLTCLIAAFLLAAQLFSHDRGLLRLCRLLAINAVLISFFGIVQKVSGTREIYGILEVAEHAAPFGPFVNHNHAGGFLNISLGAAFVLLVATLDVTATQRADTAKSPLRSLPRSGSWLSQLTQDPRRLWSLVGICCVSAGLVCTMSRGSILAWIVAGLLTCLAVPVVRSRARLLQIWLAVVAGALLFVAWSGQIGAFQSRMGTLSSLHDERLDMWTDMVEAVPQFWLSGSGIGTFRYLSPLYQERFMKWRYLHAENQYLEALIEGGWLGLLLLLAAIALVGYSVWRLQTFGNDRLSRAAAFGGLFALGSQVIGGALDFGLYTPANALAMALFCGALTGRAARLAPAGARNWMYGVRVPRLGGAVAFAMVAWGMYWALGETRCVTGAAMAVEGSPRNPSMNPDLAELEFALDISGRAQNLRPDDADVEARIAELLIGTYRKHRYIQLLKELLPNADLAAADPATEPSSGADEAPASEAALVAMAEAVGEAEEGRRPLPTAEQLWDRTSPSVLHENAWEAWFDEDLKSLQELRSEPLVAKYLKPAVDHLVRARQLCPVLPLVHYRLAELACLAGDPTGDEIHLARAIRLDAGDADKQYGGGLLDLQARRYVAACTKWRRCNELIPWYQGDIIALARQRMPFQVVVREILPQNSRVLVELALAYSGEHPRPEAPILAAHAQDVLKDSTEPDAERHYLAGVIAQLQSDIVGAISEFGKAVELSPRKIEWRYQLALLLWRNQELETAAEQLETCVAMDRTRTEYRNTLQQVQHELLAGSDNSSNELIDD